MGPRPPRHVDPRAVLPWSAHEVLAKNFTRSFAGYPPPQTASHDGQLAGFLPPSRALSDVAVLDVRSFSLSPSPYNFPEYSRGYDARLNASLWEQVAEVTWKKGKCVHGSTSRNDSRMGGVSSYTPAVEGMHRLGEGVGST